MSTGKRLRVDWAACDAHGLCSMWAPDLVGRDEWGYPVLAEGEVPRALLAQARDAVRACPLLALALVPVPRGRRAGAAERPKPFRRTPSSTPTNRTKIP